MAKAVLIGIDLGTTVLKVCAFDEKTGRVLGRAARRLVVRPFANEGREQSPAGVERAFRGALGEVRREIGDAWAEVAGIGLAAQGGSSILADRATGEARTPMVLWNDGRSAEQTRRLAGEIKAGYWRKHLLNEWVPHGLGRLRWLKERHANLFGDDCMHVGAGEFLFHRLTGVWRQDAGNAIQAGSYNVAKRKLDRDPFRLSGQPLSFVAPLRQGHETAPLCAAAARALRLPEGLPVAGPYIDQEAAYLSAAGCLERPLQCSLGTAWVGNFALAAQKPDWFARQLAIPSPGGPGCLVILPLAAGNLTWEWALKTFVGETGEKALGKASAIFAKSLTPPEGLVALPWLTQPNPFAENAHGAGGFVGVSTGTEPAELLRAVVAGMTFELARIFQHVRDAGAVDGVVLGGGASNGVYFRKLIAGLFEPLPVWWQTDADLAAARGAVFAFAPKAAAGTVRRVKAPAGENLERIERGFRAYERAVKEGWGAMIGGEPYPFGKGSAG